jgi:DNA replication protein DnaC
VSQDGFVIGQLAGAFAEAKEQFQAEIAADLLILDDIGAERWGRRVATAVFGCWLTPSLA